MERGHAPEEGGDGQGAGAGGRERDPAPPGSRNGQTSRGAKPLRYAWRGPTASARATYRVIFHIVTPGVIVVRIMHRSVVYED